MDSLTCISTRGAETGKLYATAGFVRPDTGRSLNARITLRTRALNGNIFSVEAIAPDRPAAIRCETSYEFGRGERFWLVYRPGAGWRRADDAWASSETRAACLAVVAKLFAACPPVE